MPADFCQRLILHVCLIHVVQTPDEPTGTQPEKHPEGTTEDANQHSDKPAGRKALADGIVGVLWYLKLPRGVAFDDRRALEFYAALAVKALEGAQRLIRLTPLIESHGDKVHGHGFAPDPTESPYPVSARRLGWATPPMPVSRVISENPETLLTGMSSRMSNLLGHADIENLKLKTRPALGTFGPRSSSIDTTTRTSGRPGFGALPNRLHRASPSWGL
ncbi:MAG: hypothetical protein WCB92_33020 [Mycobacterium sp.]